MSRDMGVRAFLLSQEEKPCWVINASPELTVEEWQKKHGLIVIESPQQVTKEKAIANQLIDQYKQETWRQGMNVSAGTILVANNMKKGSCYSFLSSDKAH